MGFAVVGTVDNKQPADICLIKMAGDGTVLTRSPIRPELQLNLFPNPASEMLQAELRGGSQGMAQAVLFDAGGRQIRAWAFEKTGEIRIESIDVGQLPAGPYFLTILVDGVRYARQWVKR